MAATHLSRAAFERLQAEHYDLTTRGRIEVAQKIEAARLLGDLSENGDYHAAKDEQGHMEGRIRQLEHLLANAEIIDGGEEGVVAAGTVVTIVYEGDSHDLAETYLLGHLEERSGGLEVMSPQSALGSALIGAAEGHWVEYTTPTGATLPYLLTGSLAALHGAVADWPAAAWAHRPAPGEWSLTEIAGHLRDVEREVNLPRLHAVIEQDNPFLAGADTDPWAITRNYAAQSGPQALADFSRSRQETIAYLRRQPATVWQRTARHAIFGPTLLVEIVGWMLDHDRLHLAQVRATQAHVAAPAA